MKIPEKIRKRVERIEKRAKKIVENEEDSEKMFSKLREMCIDEGAVGIKIIDEGKVRFDTISKEKVYSNLRLKKEAEGSE